MSKRQESAVNSEGSTLVRALSSVSDVVDPIASAPLFGYGVGAGSNAGNAARGAGALSLGETELARMVNELGFIFGYPIVLLRILFAGFLGYLAIIINRKTGNGAALILFGVVGPLLLVGQITMQNQILAISWFLIGLFLAFLRLAKEKKI